MWPFKKKREQQEALEQKKQQEALEQKKQQEDREWEERYDKWAEEKRKEKKKFEERQAAVIEELKNSSNLCLRCFYGDVRSALWAFNVGDSMNCSGIPKAWYCSKNQDYSYTFATECENFKDKWVEKR